MWQKIPKDEAGEGGFARLMAEILTTLGLSAILMARQRDRWSVGYRGNVCGGIGVGSCGGDDDLWMRRVRRSEL